MDKKADIIANINYIYLLGKGVCKSGHIGPDLSRCQVKENIYILSKTWQGQKIPIKLRFIQISHDYLSKEQRYMKDATILIIVTY